MIVSNKKDHTQNHIIHEWHKIVREISDLHKWYMSFDERGSPFVADLGWTIIYEPISIDVAFRIVKKCDRIAWIDIKEAGVIDGDGFTHNGSIPSIALAILNSLLENKKV